MLVSTQVAIRALLRADTSLSGDDRTRVLSLLTTPTNDAKTAPDRPRLLRRRDVAKMLGVTTKTIDNLSSQGALSKVKFPGRCRAAGFRESDVLALIACTKGGQA